MTQAVRITLYKWGGRWGPFSVKIPCGECTLTKDILLDTFKNELKDIPVKLEIKDWLSYWWEPLRFGAFHAPILMVENKVISQGEALNRGRLIQSVVKEWAKRDTLKGNIMYGKATCPYCVKAKTMLNNAGIAFDYHDVIKDSAALYRMIPEVKANIGEKTPITVPQIWIESRYVGGFDKLEALLKRREIKY